MSKRMDDDDDVAPARITSSQLALRLKTTNEGKPLNKYWNIAHIIRHWNGIASLTYDEMASRPLIRVARDDDDAQLDEQHVSIMRERIEEEFSFAPAADNVRMALAAVATEGAFHPVRDYLTKLRWDGTMRIDAIARDVLRCEDSPLARSMVRAWFIGAVARALRPGCKMDTCLILQGKTGDRKSTFFDILGSPWFSCSPIDIGSRDGIMQFHATWMYELAEIDGLLKSREDTVIKRFVSAREDAFRSPYARSVQVHPRSSVFCGTTEATQMFRDPESTRRFWFLRVLDRIDFEWVRKWRDQIWAEAVVRFESGESWWLDETAESQRTIDIERHGMEDPWTEKIADWLDSPARKLDKVPVTVSSVMSSALSLELVHQHEGAQSRVMRVLKRLGWSPEVGDGRRLTRWSETPRQSVLRVAAE